MVYQKDMPSFDHIRGTIELDNPYNDLRWYDDDTSSQGDPSDGINGPANIALPDFQHGLFSEEWSTSTNSRLTFSGAISAVQ